MTQLALKIGTRIRNYRKSAGLTQEKLAAMSGLHNTYIGQLERGEKNATLDSIAKVTEALNIPLETLFKNVDMDTSLSPIDECYDLLTELTADEQKAIVNIVETIISFKHGDKSSR